MQHIQIPDGVTVILASKSPRRKVLLGEMGIPFTTMTCDITETYPAVMHPSQAVRFLSEKKARAVAEIAPKNAIIIASDTMVEVDGEPLGKPKSKEDAARMLWKLSGRHHNVHTGVCVMWGEKMLSDVDTTDVFFLPLDQKDIDDYIATGEPMDKAGAYGIQGRGGHLVSHVNGHLDTVIGLPCDLLEEMLRNLLGQ